MVDISHTLDSMQKLVEGETYFTVNRGRQYGKTTTLSLLRNRLESLGYVVFFISFEGLEDEVFESVYTFYPEFFSLMEEKIRYGLVKVKDETERLIKSATTDEKLGSRKAGTIISDICLCEDRKVVLLIDEVDNAGNFPVFLKFLGMLRTKYLSRDEIPTFRSVILAGVYDIKNLKMKIRPEEEHQYNSPWNVAVGYTGDMSLPLAGIENMLQEYEADHHTGMDVTAMAKCLWDYTSGYPFLVSRLCQLMDESDSADAWTNQGFQKAVKTVLGEGNTLFDDVVKKLDQFPKLHEMLYEVLYSGKRVTYNRDDREMNIAGMFGYIYDKDGAVAVSNRLLEMRLYNLFVAEASKKSDEMYTSGSIEKNQFIRNGELDMPHILERFVVHYTDIYGKKDEKFHEKEGRKFFLFYLKPIINGTGNYYVEAETFDEGRMDVVVDYLGRQYVIELKIWRGMAYHEEGEQQLAAYLESMHLEQGYMLTFNFNQKKYTGVKEVKVEGKTLWEAVV